jgi:hypothetical protein
MKRKLESDRPTFEIWSTSQLRSSKPSKSSKIRRKSPQRISNFKAAVVMSTTSSTSTSLRQSAKTSTSPQSPRKTFKNVVAISTTSQLTSTSQRLSTLNPAVAISKFQRQTTSRSPQRLSALKTAVILSTAFLLLAASIATTEASPRSICLRNCHLCQQVSKLYPFQTYLQTKGS